MRKCVCGLLIAAAVAGLALPAAGQVGGDGPKSATPAQPVQASRLPYTAEFKISSVKTRAGGETITHQFTETIVSDAQGRVMIANTAFPLSGDLTVRTHFSVVDPVARTISGWDLPGHKATVTPMPASDVNPPCPPTAAFQPSAQLPEPVVVDLGTQTIHGVEARGRLSTTTIPAGTAGNDAQLVSTGEVWIATAPGFHGLMVRQILDDPQTIKLTKELVNLNQRKPDPAVFQPPAGYKIVKMGAPKPVCEIRSTATEPPSPQK
jgi:hypothetical protein